jgi:ATP-dependent exoDNAse (exonuclease V) beta subunit
MTIHRAKGLEFDTVIVPGLHRTTGGVDQKLMRWEEVAFEGTRERLVAAPIKRGRKKEGAASLYSYLKVLEDERGGNEDVRALYVAATRAKRALHWVGVAEEKKDGSLAPPAGSFLKLLWPALEADFAQAELVEGDGGAEEAAAFVPKLLRLPEPLEEWVPAALRMAASEPEAAAAPEAAPVAAIEEEGGRLSSDVGTLVHAYLEMIARDGPDAWPLERIEGLREAMALWFAQQGHGDEEAAEGARRARAALNATLASEQGRWVLAAREGAAAELAVTMAEAGADGGRISTQVVDRTFVEGGVRWIIDYKTAEAAEKLGAGEAAREALAAHAERYRPQLQRYARLFAGEGLQVRLGIFYAAAGRLVELG